MSATGYGRISFESLDEVIIVDGITCFDEGTIVLREGLELYLDQGRLEENVARPRQQLTQRHKHSKGSARPIRVLGGLV